jgi:hypothetical protein
MGRSLDIGSESLSQHLQFGEHDYVSTPISLARKDCLKDNQDVRMVELHPTIPLWPMTGTT